MAVDRIQCKQHERFKKNGGRILFLMLCNHNSEVTRSPYAGIHTGARNERAGYGMIKTAATTTVVHFPSAPQVADAAR